MTTRRAKQLVYGALYLIILFCVVAVFYFIFVRPFTSGPVVAPCTSSTCAPTSTAPFSTSSVAMFVTSPGHYTFLTQALDNDPDYGAQTFDYTINLYDATGVLIDSIPGQSFIYQSQNKYLLAPNVVIPQTVTNASLAITDAVWTPSSTLGIEPNFSPENIQTGMTSSTVTVSGQLINQNIGSYEQVIVVVLFNDGNGNVVGATQTELDNVDAGSTQNFTVAYPAVSNIDPSKYQVLVYALR